MDLYLFCLLFKWSVLYLNVRFIDLYLFYLLAVFRKKSYGSEKYFNCVKSIFILEKKYLKPN